MKKNTVLLGLLLALTFFFACKPTTSTDSADVEVQSEESSTSTDDGATLEGTWRLVSAKLAHRGEGEQQNFSDDSEVIYYKIFTKRRFLAFRYNNDSRLFMGASGGTYIQLGDEFREYIEMHSWDSTLIEVPQTFTCTFRGDTLIQEGTLKGGTDPDAYLKEVYVRVEPPMSTLEDKHELCGVWLLDRWANGDAVRPEQLEVGTQGYKLITPNYFVRTRWRNTGGVIDFIFGSVKLAQDYYTEKIISFPDPSAIDKEYTFSWKVDNNEFAMTGFIDSDQFMDYKIEEYYAREE